MKKFKIVFTDEAMADINRSFEWGKKNWGIEQARNWYRDLRSNIRKSLGILPLGLPIAPETDELGMEVRHLIVGRYRVIFEIIDRTVRIVHVKGAFVDESHRR